METSFVIFIALLFSAFFSGMEIAFITSNKFRIELESKSGNVSARIYSFFNNNPSRFLATMLLGNNIALVVFGIFMESLLAPYFGYYTNSEITIFFCQTIVSTLLILIAGEFLPKNLFRINPNFTLNIFAIPVIVIYYLLYPVVYLTITISEFIIEKVFRIQLPQNKIVFGRVDLDHYVREVTSSSNQKKEIDHEIQIFQNALDFSEVKARECMIPRNEIVAFEVNESIEDLRLKFIETGLSKILIYDDTIDNIIGYVHSFELFKKPESIRSVLLPVAIVPESIPANEVLTVFIQQHKSLAVVVDEFGGTSGILTMEDVIEEIFGEIEDEHDKEDLMEKQLGENEFLFSGRLEIDYINDKYNLKMPVKDEYETLGGFIIHYFESIPKINEEIIIGKFVFSICKVSGTRIEEVRLTISSEDA